MVSLGYKVSPDAADRYLYEYDNTATWLAEVLDGSMRTSFEFHFDYGHDGTPLSKVFNDSLHDAERLVNEKPNLLFGLRRRHIERQEYSDMRAMARGELSNTMVVFQTFRRNSWARLKMLVGTTSADNNNASRHSSPAGR